MAFLGVLVSVLTGNASVDALLGVEADKDTVSHGVFSGRNDQVIASIYGDVFSLPSPPNNQSIDYVFSRFIKAYGAAIMKWGI